ncbi:hypothetical protein AAIE21_10415 [Paenibacillus sp. 102]|uniref:hypothetical protein n=1 Tax=Paenibacillus sp. 102 TaxID=3120823 RepID=UPI0031BAB633
MPVHEFLKYVKCENLGFADITQLYGKEKYFRRMCRYRKIDFAYRGMRVQVAGRMGTIVGNYKTNLFVVLDGDFEKCNVHPWWEIAHLDEEGNIVRDYRKGVYAV